MEVLQINNQRHLCLSRDDRQFKKLKNFLKHLFVRVQPTGRKKQIRDLIEYAGDYVFNTDTGRTTVQVRTLPTPGMTLLTHMDQFQRHFHRTHSIMLKHPRMFGVVTGKERKVVYPAEVCSVEAGQFYRKKVPTEFTKSVVDFATKNPHERMNTIDRGIGLGHQGGLAAPVSHSRTSVMQLEFIIPTGT
jgi:eukaryotic translation initiation factor 2C